MTALCRGLPWSPTLPSPQLLLQGEAGEVLGSKQQKSPPQSPRGGPSVPAWSVDLVAPVPRTRSDAWGNHWQPQAKLTPRALL